MKITSIVNHLSSQETLVFKVDPPLTPIIFDRMMENLRRSGANPAFVFHEGMLAINKAKYTTINKEYVDHLSMLLAVAYNETATEHADEERNRRTYLEGIAKDTELPLEE